MSDRRQEDADLEALMSELGRVRYRNTSAQSMMGGRATDTKAGRTMLREAVVKLEVALKDWTRKAKRRAGAGHSSAGLLAGLKPGVVAFITARTVLDAVALNMPLTATANAVGGALEEERRHQAIAKAARGLLKDTKGKSGKTSLWPDIRRRLRRTARGGKSRKKAIARAIAAQVEAQFEAWPRRDRLRLGVTLVELLRLHTGLIEIRTVPRDGRRPHAVVGPTDATLNWIEQADARAELMSPVWLPMRTRPNDWVDAWTGGYRLNEIARRPIVKARDRKVVEAVEKADPKIVYRAISSLQRTAWRVNRPVLDVAKALWDSGTPIAGFQERIDEPRPVRPENATDEEQARWVRETADYRKRYHQNRGRRVMLAKTLHLAETYKLAPEFFYPVQVDFRGRCYPVPFFLTYQSDDLSRGLLEFARGKPIRDREAAEWFKGAGAGLFGINRVAHARRVEWTQGQHDKILAVAADPLGFRWWLEADEPWQMLAWCFEYAQWFRAPATFESRFRVGLDGSANGLQLFSLLMRDEVGAAATNVSPAETPADVYQSIADRATGRLMADTDPYAAQWANFLGGKISRAYCKHAAMTLAYKSTFHSAVNAVRDLYELQRMKQGATPFEALSGGGYRASTFLAEHIWAAVGDTVGKAREAMSWLCKVSDILTAHGLPICWVAPSGFPVRQAYVKYESQRIATSAGDGLRFIRYREDRDVLSPKQQSNGISANYIHSLDAAILAFAVVRARERGVNSLAVIHDSYNVLAADAPVMSRTLTEVVSEMFQVDLLSEFKAGIERQLPPGVQLPPLPEYGSLDPKVVKDARFFYS